MLSDSAIDFISDAGDESDNVMVKEVDNEFASVLKRNIYPCDTEIDIMRRTMIQIEHA